MPKFKYTAEEHLWYLRLLRREKGLKNREGRHYLKELRKERGITQAQLAKRAGVSQQFISRIESNWANVGPKTVERLAGALGIDRLELTLLEMIYRHTFARESYFSDDLIEELDVDRWTLEEAMYWASWHFGYYEDEDPDEGIASEEEANRANAAMKRLRERYGTRRSP